MFEQLTELFTQHRYARAIALGVNATLSLIFAWIILRLVFVVAGLVWMEKPATSNLTLAKPADTTTFNLAGLHLFGKVTAAAPVSIAANANFELRGIFASNDPTRGQAILKDNNSVESMYRVGDGLSDGSKIVEIYPDRVELDRNGAREQLRLPKSTIDTQSARAEISTSAGDQNQSVATPFDSAAPPISSFITSQIATQPVVYDPVSKQQVLNQRATQIDAETIQPVIENGQFAGVKVRGLNAEWLQRAGLGSDDVLTAVNGQTITSVNQAQQIALSLASAGEATLSVRRNGKIETIKIKSP